MAAHRLIATATRLKEPMMPINHLRLGIKNTTALAAADAVRRRAAPSVCPREARAKRKDRR
jgi:hypothetical protein